MTKFAADGDTACALLSDRMAAQEALHGRRYRCGMSHHQGMVSAGHFHVVGLGKPGQDEAPDLGEPETAMTAADVQDRLTNPSCLRGPETPVQQGRKVGREEGIGVAFALGDGAGKVPFDVAAPVRADEPSQEPVQRRRPAVPPVILPQLVIAAMNRSLLVVCTGGGSMRVRVCTDRGAVTANCRATAAL